MNAHVGAEHPWRAGVCAEQAAGRPSPVPQPALGSPGSALPGILINKRCCFTSWLHNPVNTVSFNG